MWVVRIVLGIFVSVVLVGCITSSVTIVNSFDASQAAFIRQTGDARIFGEAFMRRSNGRVVYSAGWEVYLVPSTKFSDERYKLLFQGKKAAPVYKRINFENDSPEFYKYIRKTKANGQGQFEFSDVANGSYYVLTRVVWKKEPDGVFPKGAHLMEKVTVTAGEKSYRLIMTGS